MELIVGCIVIADGYALGVKDGNKEGDTDGAFDDIRLDMLEG